MAYVPVPLEQLQIGRPLPVDIRSPDGRLLMGRGQTLNSESLRHTLAAHQASMSESDAKAWQRALDRGMRQMLARGLTADFIAGAPVPIDILDIDYIEVRQVDGGWLDLQEILRGLLYQGAQAVTPLPRLLAIEQKALALLAQDADDGLLVLFQNLPDLSLGYCATHALLSGVVGVLTADKLGLPTVSRELLMRSALVMNIGMARPQDGLTRQLKAPSEAQRDIITTHASLGADILRGFGVQDPEWLGMVRWHHEPEAALGQLHQQTGLRLLNLADTLVAKMAPRVSREAMSTLGAAKSLVMESDATTQSLRAAMAAVLGFYPPGTYVQLANGETAVVVARGKQANTPQVASLIKADGMPMSNYVYRDTNQEACAVRAPVSFNSVNIKVNVEKVRRLRYQRGI
jgi:HD-GYP domain-containing protein (c-di-GMP phosphodiesterase class II)